MPTVEPTDQPVRQPSASQGMGWMPDDDRLLKEMKVRIPEDQHIKLHGIRLVRDQGISETVRRALENYFANRPDTGNGAVDG